MILKNKISSIEVSLRPNPHVIANLRRAIKAALNVSLCANKYAITNLKCFKMLEANTTADANLVAESARNRPPNCPTHQCVQFAISDGKALVLFQQTLH